MPINKDQLPVFSQRQRFLEELEEHNEDSGRTESLGTTDELIHIFSMYTQTRRQQQRNFILSVAGSLLLLELFSRLAINVNNMHTVWAQIPLMVSRLLFLPVQYLIVLPYTLFMPEPFVSESTSFLVVMTIILPLLTIAFWTALATLVRFPPRLFTRRLTHV